MIKKIAIAAATLALTLLPAVSQEKPKAPKAKDFTFTTVKEIPVTPVKNQYRSGTCWCFSTLSFLESEIIKNKAIKDTTLYPDLSEMFIVRNSYHDRALKYVRLDGALKMAAGSDFGDVFDVIKTYGLIPQSVYSGMNYGTDLPVQGELDAVLKAYVEAVVKNPNRKLTPVWSKGFDGILDAYLGPIPSDFTFEGASYTPESYFKSLGIDLNDYVSLTSFTHHPFYEPFAIEVEDNWRWTPSWNLPLDEFMAVINNAVDNGYTVLWGGDVSELGFTRDGLAILLDTEAKQTSGSDQEKWVGKEEDKPAADAPKKPSFKEIVVTQENRQDAFDQKQTTDDHGMHLYGTATDADGNKYFLIKNSWGKAGEFKGLWYMSEAYCMQKTLNIMVNKKALPKDIQKKLGIKVK